MSASFLWGVATSPYQHEGGYNGEDTPHNNWSAWERSGRVERVGRAVDFWHRYQEDFDLAAAMGLNAFRLGIDWCRLQPAATAPLDERALDHYGAMLVAARRRGLEPLLTLHHFTHPAWMGEDVWLRPETPALFAAYATRALDGLNRRLTGQGQAPLRWILTINEPNMLALNTHQVRCFPGSHRHGPESFFEALLGMAVAHVRAWRELHALYQSRGWPTPMISFNTYASDLYWADGLFADVLHAPSAGVVRDEMLEWLHERRASFDQQLARAGLSLQPSHAQWVGRAIQWMHRKVAGKALTMDRLVPLLDLLYQRPGERPMDFLGLDYYDPFSGHALRLPRFSDLFPRPLSLRDWIIQSIASKWWEWRHLPEGLDFFCRRLARDLPGLPILIAENGMAQQKQAAHAVPWRHDRLSRADYLRAHVTAVQRLAREGLPLIGYFYWSLTDNYEWGTYTPRFGLYHVDVHSEGLERRDLALSHPTAAKVYAELVRQRPAG